MLFSMRGTRNAHYYLLRTRKDVSNDGVMQVARRDAFLRRRDAVAAEDGVTAVAAPVVPGVGGEGTSGCGVCGCGVA